MKKYLLASLLAASAPFALAADSLARNKENVVAFYELSFNQHKEDAFIAGAVFDAVAAEIEGSFVHYLALLDNS